MTYTATNVRLSRPVHLATNKHRDLVISGGGVPEFQGPILECYFISPMREKASEEWIQRLNELGIPGGKVAHFGCAKGIQTLALAWRLQASEVYGIDRDIAGAQCTFKDLRMYLEESKLALLYTSQKERTWWKDAIPEFLKRCSLPKLIEEQDIAHPTQPFQLPDDYFDIACCSNLLYQILDEQGAEGVRLAIQEMMRVVKVGGWLVADEPDDTASACFKSSLEYCHLDIVETQTYTIRERALATTYYCRKPQECNKLLF